MNITWIIGNGFDINLGLRTGYRAFLENCYLRGDDPDGHRERLMEACEAIQGAELWSDLEELLGKASQGYSEKEAREFHLTFEEMQRLFTDYVYREELRLPEELPDDCVKEFKDSICDFGQRMVPSDKRHFDRDSIREHITYNFISLNYTSSLDMFVKAATSTNKVITSHVANNKTFNDVMGTLLHLHGSIGDDGTPQDIVFGVSNPDQIANQAFADDAFFTRLWIKEQKNSSHYGNDNVQRADTLINNSHVFCIYGCSLGKSDQYIWHKVAARIKKDTGCRAVLFIYDLPDRHGHGAFEYEQSRSQSIEDFRQVSGLAPEEFEPIAGRIAVVGSQDYFHMDALRGTLAPVQTTTHSAMASNPSGGIDQ